MDNKVTMLAKKADMGLRTNKNESIETEIMEIVELARNFKIAVKRIKE